MNKRTRAIDEDTYKLIIATMKNGFVHVLGSDSHNMDRRAPNLGETCRKLSQMGVEDVLLDIQETSSEIFMESVWGSRD